MLKWFQFFISNSPNNNNFSLDFSGKFSHNNNKIYTTFSFSILEINKQKKNWVKMKKKWKKTNPKLFHPPPWPTHNNKKISSNYRAQNKMKIQNFFLKIQKYKRAWEEAALKKIHKKTLKKKHKKHKDGKWIFFLSVL